MGSTGDADRKRRHFSSVSPTSAAGTKKQQPFLRSSEDSKLSTTVLQFQNLKLNQKLEAQKVEHSALENKFSQLKEKQQPYNATLTKVNRSWEEMVRGLESRSAQTREASKGPYYKQFTCLEDLAPSPQEDAFLSRLLETGATESSSTHECSIEIGEDREAADKSTKSIIHNILGASNNLWHLKDGLLSVVLKELPDEGSSPIKISSDLKTEVKNLRLAVNDLYLKHREIAKELRGHQNIDAKDKAELKHLRGELDSTIAELEESSCELSILKAEKDGVNGAKFPVLNFGSKHIVSDKVRDKRKDAQDMESTNRELTEQALSRLLELKSLHEKRKEVLPQLSTLVNTLKNVKSISSSQTYLLMKDQLDKSKSDAIQYQALSEKLQVEKDNLAWRETELNFKNDLADVYRRSSAVADSRIADLEVEMQKQINERNVIRAKLEVETREPELIPGRKEIIAEFKSLVSSFPEKMGIMQNQLSKYKEAASDVHALRAEVQSLSKALDSMAKGCESLSARSADQVAEIQTLQAVVQGLKDSGLELKLIVDMYRHESTASRDVLEARDLEYKAWAHIQGLKSSLDEHSLESRVKAANEAEAISQQRLAAAEADIADLRQKSEASKRGISRLSDILKSKSEENEDYLSEIETIGQAYDDMQTQNQHLLQQITERDDYNIKLVLEGVRARQMQGALFMNKQILGREVHQANASLELYELKAARIEDQLKICSEQVRELTEDKHRSSTALENIQKRLLDIRRSSQQARESLEESQSKVVGNRMTHAELNVELDRERFEKKRLEEELEVVSRRAARLRAETEGSSVVGKLRQELKEYKDILKCSVCANRPKEVVITKCYHLFCNPCVKRIIETRHRKCPVCSASFGVNDVKPVYI